MPSSVIARIEYDPGTTTLRIIFVSGKVYDYEDVPEHIYIAMKTSGSKGIFFNNYIKEQYNFKKVDEAKTD